MPLTPAERRRSAAASFLRRCHASAVMLAADGAWRSRHGCSGWSITFTLYAYSPAARCRHYAPPPPLPRQFHLPPCSTRRACRGQRSACRRAATHCFMLMPPQRFAAAMFCRIARYFSPDVAAARRHFRRRRRSPPLPLPPFRLPFADCLAITPLFELRIIDFRHDADAPELPPPQMPFQFSPFAAERFYHAGLCCRRRRRRHVLPLFAMPYFADVFAAAAPSPPLLRRFAISRRRAPPKTRHSAFALSA